jgi:hypothetical protein
MLSSFLTRVKRNCYAASVLYQLRKERREFYGCDILVGDEV